MGYFFYKNGRVEAVRRGQWKLRPAKNKPELYDLDADISESKNLAADNPEIVAELQKLIADYDADLKANSRPVWRAGK